MFFIICGMTANLSDVAEFFCEMIELRRLKK